TPVWLTWNWFINALAGELGLNIYAVNLSSKDMTDDTLLELVSVIPPRCLLLIEDVDAAFIQRESNDAVVITFSGLLNSVDGVSAQEALHDNQSSGALDEALIRPGRVDVQVRFGKATQSQPKELFIKFYPHPTATIDTTPKEVVQSDKATEALGSSPVEHPVAPVPFSQTNGTGLTAKETEALAEQFAMAIPDHKFSIAQLQGFLMGYKKTPALAVKHVDEFERLAGNAE
ncbi:hypothetical protein BGZ65_000410, partial [Modicella reniformis]